MSQLINEGRRNVIGTAVNLRDVFTGRSLMDEGHRENRNMLRDSKNKSSGLFAPFARRSDTLNMVQLSNLDLWRSRIGEKTVHDEPGAFQ